MLRKCFQHTFVKNILPFYNKVNKTKRCLAISHFCISCTCGVGMYSIYRWFSCHNWITRSVHFLDGRISFNFSIIGPYVSLPSENPTALWVYREAWSRGENPDRKQALDRTSRRKLSTKKVAAKTTLSLNFNLFVYCWPFHYVYKTTTLFLNKT